MDRVEGVTRAVLHSSDFTVLLYRCSLFALRVCGRITLELLFSWQNTAPYVSAGDIHRTCIAAWALAWPLPPSTGGEEWSLASASLQFFSAPQRALI